MLVIVDTPPDKQILAVLDGINHISNLNQLCKIIREAELSSQQIDNRLVITYQLHFEFGMTVDHDVRNNLVEVVVQP